MRLCQEKTQDRNEARPACVFCICEKTHFIVRRTWRNPVDKSILIAYNINVLSAVPVAFRCAPTQKSGSGAEHKHLFNERLGNTDMYYIGVDLGGTNIAVGIVDEDCKILKKASVPTNPERGADAIVGDMADVAKNLLMELSIPLSEVASAGVATPGTADTDRGVVVYANNIPFRNYPLAAELSEKLGGIPAYIENDANAAAKAEAFAGVAKGTAISVMITLGTGLGGGIVENGKVYSGFNYAGAELGHVVIEKDGRPCSCGRHGCWEAYSSATGLVNITRDRVEEAMKAGRSSTIIDKIDGDLSKISARTAFAEMKNGDALGAEIVDEYIGYLACGVTNMINIFQPNVLSIGGGICNEGDALLKPLCERVAAERYSRDDIPNTEIKIAELGNDAGIIGAAVLGR